MTDRWKDELKKLRGVEPPDGLWDRARQPPSADRPPPRRERIVAGVVAMSVFVAAGAFAFQALRPAGGSTAGTIDKTTTVVVDFFAIANQETPRARMTFGGTSVEGVGTSYCWTFEGGSGCADTIEPSFLDAEYLQIPRGTRLAITGNVTKVAARLERGTLLPFEIVKNLGVVDEGIDLDFMPDRYVLELTGEWPDVSRSFYFPVEIVEPDGVAGPRVTVTLLESNPAYPAEPTADMSFGGESTRGQFVSLEWGNEIFDIVSPELTGFVPVPQGAELVIEGDAESVDGYLGQTRLPFDRVSGLDVGDGTASLDVETGKYALVLTGLWSQGDVPFVFGIEIVEESPTPSPIVSPDVPDVAKVVCDEGAIRLLTPVVAAQPDGVHLVFDNRSGAEAFELHSVTSADGTTAGGMLKASGETKSGGLSIEPGELQVACLPSTSDSYLNQPWASLTVEDPNGLWIPTELSCGDATVETTGAIENVYGLPDDEVERAIRDATVGLAGSDEVLKPGYPGTRWMTVILVVRRGDAIVARIEDVSGFKIEACDGSGIAAVPTLDIPLVCGVAAQIAFEHTGGVDEPAGEAFVRVNTIGILSSDVLTHTGPASGPTGDDGIWTVTRDGSVIAWVDYPDLNGVACAGTRVGGVADS